MTAGAEQLRDEVRERYAEAARSVTEGTNRGCCPDGSTDEKFGEALYAAEERGELPVKAVLASLGCGNPTAVADLHEGETVLDLGSGGGIDVILSAKRVGPTGTAFGLDMTDEMLALAQHNAREGRGRQCRLPEGRDRGHPAPRRLGRRRDLELRHQPVRRQGCRADGDGSRAAARRPDRRSRTSWRRTPSRLRSGPSAGSCGCIAGALSKSEYEEGLRAAGFDDVSVEFTHQVAEGMHGAIVKAVKSQALAGSKPLPLVAAQPSTGCC